MLFSCLHVFFTVFHVVFSSLCCGTLTNTNESVHSTVLLVSDQEAGNPDVCVQLSWLTEDQKPLPPHLCLAGIVTTIMTLLYCRALRSCVMFVCNG